MISWPLCIHALWISCPYQFGYNLFARYISPLSTSHRFYGHLWLISGNHPYLFCLSKMITEVRSSIPLTLSNEIYIGHVRLEWMMRGKRNRVALISMKVLPRNILSIFIVSTCIHFNSNYPILFIMLLFGLLTVVFLPLSRKKCHRICKVLMACGKRKLKLCTSFNSAIG